MPPPHRKGSSGQMDNDLLDWSKRLGWRLTDSRRAVLKAVLSMNGYLDADEIVGRAQRFDAGASRATVYRSLPQLCDAGLLRKTDVGEGAVRFSRATPGETPSAEIYIEDCDYIVKVPAPFLDWYAQSIVQKVGLELTGHRLQAFGRCPRKKPGEPCHHCPEEALAKLPSAGTEKAQQDFARSLATR